MTDRPWVCVFCLRDGELRHADQDHDPQPCSRCKRITVGRLDARTASYEPPRVELVGNLHDRLAEVCAGGDCDPD